MSKGTIGELNAHRVLAGIFAAVSIAGLFVVGLPIWVTVGSLVLAIVLLISARQQESGTAAKNPNAKAIQERDEAAVAAKMKSVSTPLPWKHFAVIGAVVGLVVLWMSGKVGSAMEVTCAIDHPNVQCDLKSTGYSPATRCFGVMVTNAQGKVARSSSCSDALWPSQTQRVKMEFTNYEQLCGKNGELGCQAKAD